MVYHIFNYCILGEWYRDSMAYSEAQFDQIMNTVAWKVPAGIRVFHYGSPGRAYHALTNPVLLCRPVLALDPLSLFTAKPPQSMSLHDKRRRVNWPLLCMLGRFVIYQDWDDWPRLGYADGVHFSLNTRLEVVPISFREAEAYVRQNHRHCSAPQGHKFSIGIAAPDKSLVGVAITSIPKARALNDGYTLEVNRVCCDPAYRNAASRLYGAAIRTGKAMGYHRFITYTLPSESGSSLRAAGFRQDGRTAASPNGWNCSSRPRPLPKKYPTGEKIRWVLELS